MYVYKCMCERQKGREEKQRRLLVQKCIIYNNKLEVYVYICLHLYI